MRGIAFLDGSYAPIECLRIAAEDRGYMFGDGIYEVIAIINGVPIDLDDHVNRLRYCLDELSIKFNKNFFLFDIKFIVDELLARNGRNGDYKLYIQIARGKPESSREHTFDPSIRNHSILAILYPIQRANLLLSGVKCILSRDIRWLRKDIKSVSLVANVLLKQDAKNKNCDESILYKENDVITEGATSNVFIVNDKQEILTHPADEDVLCGTTRMRVIKLAADNGIRILEREFTVSELLKAKEVFLSNSISFFIAPVIEVAGKLINGGRVGSMALLLGNMFNDYVDEQVRNAVEKAKGINI